MHFCVAPKSIPDIEEVNFFHDDKTVLHIRKPLIHYAFKDAFVVCQGTTTTKNLKDMMPEIMKQCGSQQMEAIKEIMAGAQQTTKAGAEESDEDQPPPLVGTNFEDAAKK